VDGSSLTLMSVLLLLLAAILMASHLRTWRRVRQRQSMPDELDYHRRQFRRRMQTSAMLGLLAVAMVVGQLIVLHVDSRALVLGYWAAVLLTLAWMGVLAVADVLATKHHFGRLRRTCMTEQAKLQAKIHQIRAARGNGRPSKGNHQPDSLH
jgi:hypothetical protein